MRKAVRNKWKRVLAVVLAAAMSLTMLPVDTQAAGEGADASKTETVELIPNGDFENGSEGWVGFEGGEIEVVVTQDDGQENHVLCVKNRKNSMSSAMYDLAGKLKKGVTYTISGKIKYAGTPAAKKFEAWFENRSSSDGQYWLCRQKVEESITTLASGWKEFSITYTPTDTSEEHPFGTDINKFFIAGADYFVPEEGKEVSAVDQAKHLMDYYLDDISITYNKGEEPEEPEAEALLSNGSFERAPIDTNWKGMGKTKVARAEGVAHEGNASLKVSDYTESWEGAKYELFDLLAEGKLVADKKYTLTAWAKTESGSGNLSATIKGKKKGETDASYIGFGGPVEVNSDGWSKITGEISMADYDPDTDVMEVYWSWGKTVEAGAPAVFYLDDVSLTMPSENIVRNGSFERDLEKWTGYEQGETDILAVATDEYYSGSKSVKVSNRTKCTNGPAQDMTKKLTPGSYYTASAWVKYTEGPDTKDFNLTLHTGAESSVLATGAVKKGEWTKIEGDWGMPYDMDTASNILVVETPAVETPNAANDLMDFYVDDVTILKYKDNTQALAKKFGYGNPITTNEFGADPYAIEYNGRIYVYMTADDYEFSDKDNPFSNNFGYITSLRVVSSADLMNWTDHGEIEVAGRNGGKGPAMWASHSWAPAIAHKVIDGKDKFFLYFANDASGIGVLTADTPLGPWTDPIGAALITKQTPGCTGVEWCFDPAVLVDDNGSAYIYFGGGIPGNQHDNPKTARVAKLGTDMISIDGEAVEIDAPCMFEDSGIFKFGDTYYYSYCSNFEATTVEGYPGMGTICYMTSKNPMGPFTYQGEIFSNPQMWFGVGGNNHHATFVFNNKSYFIYHAQTVSKALGVERGYRSTHIDEIALDEDGKIKQIKGTYEGIPQLTTMDPYQRIEAETIAWNAGVKAADTGRPGNLFTDYNMVLTDLQEGDWTSVSQLDFGSKGADKITVAAGSKDGGTIEVRIGYPEGKKIGEIEIPSTGSNHSYQLVTGEIEKVTGTQNIFLVFHEKKTGATTEIYQNQLKDLWTAVKAAESSLPLKEQLQRQITKGHNVSSGFAWNEGDKKAALDAKVNEAQAVVNDSSATDEQVSAAIATLNTAIDTADQYKATDKLLKEKLKYRIKYAEQLTELASLPAAQKQLLQAVINSSKQLLKDDSIMNVDYFQFTEEGGNAPSEGDKTVKEQLAEKLVTAKDVLETLGADKKAALQAVIEEVEAVLNKADASEAEITAALEKLNTAIENAEKATPKEELSERLAIAKAMLEGLSADKKAALQAVIEEVEAVLNKADASEAEITAALEKLNTAIEEAGNPGGEEPPVEKPVKDQLREKITAAKAMLANLSAEKKAALQTVIEEVEAVLNKADASEAEIQAALDKLAAAIAEAEKPGENPGDKPGNKPGDKPAEEKPGLNQAFTETSGLTYKVTAYSATNKSVTVTGANKQLTSIVIPDTLVYRKETFKVTAIGDSAFANQKSLTSVTIGKNVTAIGAKAFLNAKNLKKITFQGTAVKTIGKDAFKNINKKATFTMPKNFTSKNLKYKITKCTASVKEVALTGAAKKKLTTLNVPATVKYNGMTFKVTSVGKKAFRKQAKLKSVTIGKNVKSIGASAFEGDKQLAKIKFSGTAIKSIGKNAFKGIKKNAKFTVKKSKKAYYKKLLKKAKTKNFKI